MKKDKDIMITFSAIGIAAGFFVGWFIFKYIGY